MGSNTRHVVVVVLGDTGRSPRMQYHAHSFAELKYNVTLVGYEGEKCIPTVCSHDLITDKRLTLTDVPKIFAKIPFMSTIWKGFSIIFTLLWTFLTLPKYDTMIIQNPPMLPALIAYVIAEVLSPLKWLFCLFSTRSNFSSDISGPAALIIDWHNLGFTMLEEKFGKNSILVNISYYMEATLCSFASYHWCVSHAMSKWLLKHFYINITPGVTVLYDRPQAAFDRHGTKDMAQRHALLIKLDFTEEKLFPSTNSTPKKAQYVSSDNNRIEHTIQTEMIVSTDECTLKKSQEGGYIPIVISSTSWTPDEDFTILINALLVLEYQMKNNKYNTLNTSSGRVVVCITGKGPMKLQFENEIKKLIINKQLGVHVAVRTLWLEPEDYPIFMGCASLGICLHTSTSGLDLPMKVLDMFGSGLPVCAVFFDTLPELIQHNVNGLIFFIDDNNNNNDRIVISKKRSERSGKGKCSTQLEDQLMHCLFDIHDDDSIEQNNESGKDLLQRLHNNAANISSWDDNWNSVIPPSLPKDGIQSRLTPYLLISSLKIMILSFIIMMVKLIW